MVRLPVSGQPFWQPEVKSLLYCSLHLKRPSRCLGHPLTLLECLLMENVLTLNIVALHNFGSARTCEDRHEQVNVTETCSTQFYDVLSIHVRISSTKSRR